MNNDDMRAICAGLETTSAKIRALAAAGAPTARIAEFLGIRYQHAYNVLKAEREGRGKVREDRPAGRIVKFQVNADGSMVLPASILKGLGAGPGGEVFVRAGADGLHLLTRRAAVAELRALLADRLPEEVDLFASLLGEDD